MNFITKEYAFWQEYVNLKACCFFALFLLKLHINIGCDSPVVPFK